MADAFLVGGTEAALTPFTIAQMKALKLYSNSRHRMACESMRFQKKENTMVLGEGAAVAFLERGVSERTQAVILVTDLPLNYWSITVQFLKMQTVSRN